MVPNQNDVDACLVAVNSLNGLLGMPSGAGNDGQSWIFLLEGGKGERGDNFSCR